jgi:hypothetical protein
MARRSSGANMSRWSVPIISTRPSGSGFSSRAKAVAVLAMWVESLKFVAHEFERFVELRCEVLCFFPVNLNRHGTISPSGNRG